MFGRALLPTAIRAFVALFRYRSIRAFVALFRYRSIRAFVALFRYRSIRAFVALFRYRSIRALATPMCSCPARALARIRLRMRRIAMAGNTAKGVCYAYAPPIYPPRGVCAAYASIIPYFLAIKKLSSPCRYHPLQNPSTLAFRYISIGSCR